MTENKKTNLSIDAVEHITALAKLKLDDEELEKLRGQLISILEFVDQLKAINTDGVIPTSQVTGQENVFREDEISPGLTQEEALRNAPRTHEGFFVVKAIFE